METPKRGTAVSLGTRNNHGLTQERARLEVSTWACSPPKESLFLYSPGCRTSPPGADHFPFLAFSALNFAHRAFVAFQIFALVAADIVRLRRTPLRLRAARQMECDAHQ